MAVLAISSSAAFGAEAAVEATAVASAAEATPLPVGVAPEPSQTPEVPSAPVDVLTPDVTPVIEAPVVPVTPPTAPEPTDTGTPPDTTPVTPVPVTPTAPDATSTPAAPVVNVPDAFRPDAAPGTVVTPDATPAATPPSESPALPATPVATPDRTPIAARDGGADPVAAPGAKADVPPVIGPVTPTPVLLSPQLGQDTVASTSIRPQPQITPVDGTERIKEAVKNSAHVKTFEVKLVAPMRVAPQDTRGSILELLAGYVFPGAASNTNGAILLLFSLALLMAVVTPRIPRLHLTTLVAQRGAGCPGYNPVALRPG